MKRTQIQLPDRLYNRLKELANREETSLAEIIRRAGEYILNLYPESNDTFAVWDIPKPANLGDFLSQEEEWRILANEGKGFSEK